MAAVTIAEGPHNNVIGRKRQIIVKATAPADGDTWATGLYRIDAFEVTQIGDVAAGTDVVTPASISGGTVTLSVDGTAQDLYLIATGV